MIRFIFPIVFVLFINFSVQGEEQTGYGHLAYQTSIVLQTEQPGKLVSLKFEEGDFVSRGDIIAQIKSYELDLKIQQIRGSVDLSRIDLQIAEMTVRKIEDQLQLTSKRVEDGTESTEAFLRLKSDLEIAKLKLQRAKVGSDSTFRMLDILQEQRERLIIRSPIEGIVQTSYAEVGDVFESAGEKVIGLVDHKTLIAKVRFPVNAIPALIKNKNQGQGKHVKLKFRGLKMEAEGAIDSLSTTIDKASQTISAVIQFDQKEVSVLRPGMEVTATVQADSEDNAAKLKYFLEEESASVKKLSDQINERELVLNQMKSDIETLKQKLESGKGEVLILGKKFTSPELKKDLADRFSQYKQLEKVQYKLVESKNLREQKLVQFQKIAEKPESSPSDLQILQLLQWQKELRDLTKLQSLWLSGKSIK